MSDTTKQEAVLTRFMRDDGGWYSWNDLLAMAAHIVKLEAAVERRDSILAALREPSETVLMGAHQQLRGVFRRRRARGYLVPVIRAAVTAAEKEVEDDNA